jgi:hypothetical protein
MFVSRESELSALGKLYSKKKFQMIVIYGRRRVGKTTLIKEFVNGKPAIFFSAQEANESLNLQIFSKEVYAFFGMPETTGVFAGWHDAFMFIAEKAKTQQFILAIDEFPYIVEANRSVKSILQNIVDHKLLNTQLYLILCGSQIGFMETEVLGYKSPLFGRRTAQLRIEGFDCIDAAKMLPSASNEDKVRYYACIGGTPHYLAHIDESLTFEENIIELFFKPQGYLCSEATMLLQQELREPAMYNSILTAIATGSSRLNEISTKIGENTAKTIKYIKTLIDMRILHRLHPFGENPERSRKGVYALSDNFFRFWYRYVFLNTPAIESGMGIDIAENAVFSDLSSFVGRYAFEEVCRQYVLRRNKEKTLPFVATNLGLWWGIDPDTRTSSDIDIIADNKQEKKALLGECKWRNEPTDATDVQKLISKSHLIPGYDNYRFIFFSKAPYSTAAKQLEKERNDLELITLDMMF